MARRPSISMVGAGNLASGLGAALRAAGYEIVEIISRARPSSLKKGRALARRIGGKAVTLENARLDCDVLLICVPDDAITDCAAAITKRGLGSKVVLHCSGALTSEALAPLAKKGAAAGSMHPLMSFVEGESPSLKGVLFTVEGDAKAVAAGSRMARDIGGTVFRIDRRQKALYHAFGAFTSPLLIAHLSAAEELAEEAGLPKLMARKVMRPIVEQTLENYFQGGPSKAFSGPLVRGDVETIRKHLMALKRLHAARAVYVALARQAIEELPVARRGAMSRLLKAGS